MSKIIVILSALIVCGGKLNAMDEAYEKELARQVFAAEIRLEKAFLEQYALESHTDIFNGDTDKTKYVLNSLLACPTSRGKPSRRPVDIDLISAVTAKEATAARKALARGADPNCYLRLGNTLLITALTLPKACRRYEFVKLLLDNKASANLPGTNSLTPLHYAITQYQIDQLSNKLPVKLDTSFAIIKLLVEHGARLKFAIFTIVPQVDNARPTPLANIALISAYNEQLITYLLTHVYPEDILLGPDTETIAREIIARNSLLLRMNPIHQNLIADSVENQDMHMLEMLDGDNVEEYYGEQITANVKNMISALANPVADNEASETH